MSASPYALLKDETKNIGKAATSDKQSLCTTGVEERFGPLSRSSLKTQSFSGKQGAPQLGTLLRRAISASNVLHSTPVVLTCGTLSMYRAIVKRITAAIKTWGRSGFVAMFINKS